MRTHLPVGKVIGACQAPYLKPLLSEREEKLDMLWNHATPPETHQAYVNPVAKQLAGARLFTPKQLVTLANLPGEIS